MSRNIVDYLLNENSSSSNDHFILGRYGNMSFSELQNKINIYSNFFKKKLGKGEICILQAANSPFFIQVYLSIMHSGNIVVPIDKTYNSKYIKNIIVQIKPKMLVCDNQTKINYIDLNLSVVDKKILESFPSSKQKKSTFFEIAQLLPTTGSTATPKFVTLTHKNLISNCKSILKYLSIDTNDKIALVLPLSYTFGLSILHTFLKSQAQILICNDFIFFKNLFADILEHKCNFFAGVPSHYNLLLTKSNLESSSLHSLSSFLQAGGHMEPDSIIKFLDYFPDADFFVMYGQTEATARITYLNPKDLNDNLGSVGMPIDGVNLEILDDFGNPAKKGEIVISGDNVMKGYYNDPAQTSLVLRNGKLYTGDFGRKNSKGFLYIEGRKTSFFKSGGFRINPKEIEKIIMKIPEVIECRVFGEKDSLLGKAAKAVILVEDIEKNNKDKIKSFCRSRLPSHKIPKYVEFIDSSMLKSGKIVNQKR